MKKEYIRRIFTDWNKLKVEGIYPSGIKGEGEYKEWYDNGKLYKHCFFKNNRLNGEYKEWYDNGKLYNQCFYKDGNKDGEYKMWHINGKVYKHYLYKNGKIIKDYLK